MARARRQQVELPGEEFKRQSIPEVEEAAENYRALRDERMNLAERESNAKKSLIATMTSHGVTAFRYDDADGVERKVTLETKTNAKVGKVKTASTSDGPSDSAGQDVEVS